MDNDDAQVGRVLSRREMLVLLGGGSAAALIAGCSGGSSSPATATSAKAVPTTPSATQQAAATATSSGTSSTPSCIVRPAETEGPYFVDEKLNRSDIRSNTPDGKASEGVPLALAFSVSSVGDGGCAPLADATIDIWHCDAAGIYSDVSDMGFKTVGQNFLRGYQVTDKGGEASFTTIYPGWYQGRAVHIHFKIRTTTASGKAFEFTSQLFLAEATTDLVHASAPYAAKGRRTTLNSADSFYDGQLLLDAAKTASGYAAAFAIGLNMA